MGLLEILCAIWNHMEFYLYNLEKEYLQLFFFLWRQSNILFVLLRTKKSLFLK